MELIIRPFQPALQALHTVFSGNRAGSGLGLAARLARIVLGRYQRTSPRPAPLEMALQRAKPGSVWQPALRLHLAVRLQLASLPDHDVGRLEAQSGDKRVELFWSSQPVSQPPVTERAPTQTQLLVERIMVREKRLSALDSRLPGRARVQEPALAARLSQSILSSTRSPGSAAERVLLQRAAPPAPGNSPQPAPAAPPAQLPPIGPQALASPGLRPPSLRLDQFPAHEVNRLAAQVIETIDRRLLAQRERLGRI
jgi:hypothetical protein